SEARPPPIVGSLDETGPPGVAFDVPHDAVAMFVGFDREGLVASLIQMAVADRVMVFLPAGYVRDGEPLEERRQVTVVFGPDDEVPVIGHEAPGANPQGAFF